MTPPPHLVWSMLMNRRSHSRDEGAVSRDLTCLFCDKVKPRSQFNVEHVVPEGLGGSLVLDPDQLDVAVCTKCNSTLGAEADSAFFQDGHLKRCVDDLGLAPKLGRMRPVRVEGRDGYGRTLQFRGDVLVPSPQPDESIIFPEDGSPQLRQMLGRNRRISKEVADEVCALLERAPFDGKPIFHPALTGPIAIKSSGPISRTEVYRSDLPRRGLAKIAYEWVYLTHGFEFARRFAKLGQFALTGEPRLAGDCIASTVLDNPPEGGHCVKLYREHKTIFCEVTLFGSHLFRVVVGWAGDELPISELGVVMKVVPRERFAIERVAERWEPLRTAA